MACIVVENCCNVSAPFLSFVRIRSERPCLVCISNGIMFLADAEIGITTRLPS
jgi:hypothetical protein